MHSDKTVATIERLLRKGFSVENIAARCGTSAKFVRETRSGRRSPGGKYQHIHSKRNDAIKAMREEGHTQAEIGAVFNITAGRVGQILEKYYGMRTRPKVRRHVPQRLALDPRYEEIGKLWMQGQLANSVNALMERFELSRRHVNRAIDTYLQEIGYTRKTWRLERGRTFMKEYMADDNITLKEIAQRHGVTQQFVHKYIKRYQEYVDARRNAAIDSRLRQQASSAAVGNRAGECNAK